MTHSVGGHCNAFGGWVFGDSASSPRDLTDVLKHVRKNHQIYDDGKQPESYPHTLYHFPSQPGFREELSIVYHSGYNGSPCITDAYAPHHCSNLVLAVRELILEGYEPAKHVGVYTMTHLGSPYQKGPLGQPAEQGPLWTMDDWVRSTVKTFQGGVPRHTQKAIYGNSLGADILIKSVLDYEESLAPNRLKLAGVFGLAAALNAVDEPFRQMMFSQMGRISRAKHDLGLEVKVQMAGTSYRFNRSFFDKAQSYALNSRRERFDDMPVQFVHSANDGVMPFDGMSGKIRTVFGDAVNILALNCEEDPFKAHELSATDCLVDVRKKAKQWLKDVCKTSGVEALCVEKMAPK